MPTQRSRVNVVLNEEVLKILTFLAKHEHKSLSLVARELIEDSLKRKEDQVLSELALHRERENKKLISHEDAWNEI